MKGAPSTRLDAEAAAADSPGRPTARWRRPLVIDILVCLLVVVAVGLAMATKDGNEGRDASAISYLFAVAFGAVLILRRRWPLTTLLITTGLLLTYYILGYPVIGLAVPMAAALFSAAEHGRLRWSVGIAVGLLVVSTYARVKEGENAGQLFGYDLPSTITVMAAVIALGEAVRARRRLRRQAELDALRAAAERAAEAAQLVEAERLRIARDLHDVLAHSISVITIAAGVGLEAIKDDSTASEQALMLIRRTSKECLAELRTTLGLLRRQDTGQPAATLSPTGGLGQLDQLTTAARESGVDVTVVVDGSPEQLPVVVDTTAFRIIQEALTNVVRHATAATALVRLAYGDHQLAITVTNDGPAPTAGGSAIDISLTAGDLGVNGFGLTGMRERVELIGGELVTGRTDGGGFQVRATLPCAGPIRTRS